ncbi:MAG TPA: DUF6471 domain-containing protein, partial [Burkholderiales bacterium]|nr:DUF6471 domain-containing protein [Burkholderiales bacterium]
STLTYQRQGHKYRFQYFFEGKRYMHKVDWNERAANLLKSELKKRGVNYGQLVKNLETLGIEEKEVNVRNKLSRGSFTAAYLLQCLTAIGATTVHLIPR